MPKNVFHLLLLWSIVASMLPATITAKDHDCSSLNIQDRVEHIAKKIVKEQMDQEAHDCYNDLLDKYKAEVFEAMAVERGISVEELRKEADDDAKNHHEITPIVDLYEREDTHTLGVEMQLFKEIVSSNPMTHAGSFWRQLVERIPFSAVFKPLVYSSSSYKDALCDGDSSDVDYMFSFVFPYNISSPDNVRSFSYNAGVDSMLVYYQSKYGGIDGRGYTDRSGVWICLGDSGVANAGGEATVRQWMALHY